MNKQRLDFVEYAKKLPYKQFRYAQALVSFLNGFTPRAPSATEFEIDDATAKRIEREAYKAFGEDTA